jgi:hypothetical protein
MKRKFVAVVICLVLCAPMLLAGCAGMTPAQKGAVGGAGVGAIAGQLAGGSTKATLIGAGVGALGGALLNDAAHKNK